MSGSLRTICRPHSVFTSFLCFSSNSSRHQPRSRIRVSFRNNPDCNKPPPSLFSPWLIHSNNNDQWFHVNQKRTVACASSSWTGPKSPYDTLELEKDADEEEIKFAYRRLAKCYHPDVYDGRGNLEEGETAEARFIKIQAAYELLIDDVKRRQYDMENRVNPMKASQAWMEWLMKKQKAFDQRGYMAFKTWSEQQEREMSLRARRLARTKMDPEEEKRLLAKEKKASMEYVNNTLRRHTIVLKKRDLMRKKAEENKKAMGQLLAAEGLELDTDDETQ